MRAAELIGVTEAEFAQQPESVRRYLEFLAEHNGRPDEYAIAEALLSERLTRDGLSAAAVALLRYAGALLSSVPAEPEHGPRGHEGGA